jgi:hypothetical protein
LKVLIYFACATQRIPIWIHGLGSSGGRLVPGRGPGRVRRSNGW